MSTWQKIVSDKAAEIFMEGQNEAAKHILAFLLKCANQLDFGDSSPKEVLESLIDIIVKDREINYEDLKFND